MPVGQLYSVRDVQHDHTEERDWKQDGHAWGEEEGTPGDDKHLRVLVVDLEFITTVEIFIGEQGLLASFLGWKLPTAASLVDSPHNYAHQPENSEFYRREYGIDDQN